MLDSRAVAAIQLMPSGEYSLCIRGDYEENLGFHSFYRCLKTFKTERDAKAYYGKTYPQGTLVAFDKLTQK